MSETSILDECWEWNGTRNYKGYGRKSIRCRQYGTHRLAWAWVNGPIPPGLFVCHSCDNPPCVNPKHLFLGTTIDNTKDREAKGRNYNAKLKACKNGHALSDDNIRIRPTRNGKKRRDCLSCEKAHHKLESVAKRIKRRQLRAGPLPALPPSAPEPTT